MSTNTVDLARLAASAEKAEPPKQAASRIGEGTKALIALLTASKEDGSSRQLGPIEGRKATDSVVGSLRRAGARAEMGVEAFVLQDGDSDRFWIFAKGCDKRVRTAKPAETTAPVKSAGRVRKAS